MRVKKNVIIALWLCFLPLATLSANVQSAIQHASEALDYRFFHKLVNKDMLGQAYAQAQVEDFEPGEKELFTSKMLGYFKYPKNFWDRKVRNLDGLWQLESQLATLEGEAGHELLQEWRYTFLSKMMTFMQEKASRKALFRLTLTSKTEYNSNVNRINDDQSVSIVSNDPDGKDDWQQLLTMNLKWYPLVNHKGFSKNNKFEQTFNVINIHQMSHKSNEVLIFDTESKYTRLLKNEVLDDFTLAYRAQNFGLSGNASSRHTQSKSYSHRLKADWNFKAVKLGEGTFKETKTTLSLGYLKKKQFDLKSVAKKNADDWTFDWDQDFDYVLGKHDGSFKTTLGYRYYDTKNDPSGDYDYFLIKLSHKSDYSVGFLAQPLKLSQELSYRTKDWDVVSTAQTATTPMDEDFTYAQVKAETKVCKSTKVSLSAKQAWRGRDMASTGGSKKAKQTIVALGLNWSAP